jgi:hypothetical protein
MTDYYSEKKLQVGWAVDVKRSVDGNLLKQVSDDGCQDQW